MLGRQVSGTRELHFVHRGIAPQDAKSLREKMQTLLGRHSREIPDSRRSGGPFRSRRMILKIDAQGHYMDLVPGNRQIRRHVVGVEIADRDEYIHVLDLRANQTQRLASIRLSQAL